jgi:hypothetical protein
MVFISAIMVYSLTGYTQCYMIWINSILCTSTLNHTFFSISAMFPSCDVNELDILRRNFVKFHGKNNELSKFYNVFIIRFRITWPYPPAPSLHRQGLQSRQHAEFVWKGNLQCWYMKRDNIARYRFYLHQDLCHELSWTEWLIFDDHVR